MDARLAIVVLNYKTPGLTIDCLGTIAPQVTDDWAVLVVDNDSPDASADQIEEQIEQQGWGSWAQVIRSPVGRSSG